MDAASNQAPPASKDSAPNKGLLISSHLSHSKPQHYHHHPAVNNNNKQPAQQQTQHPAAEPESHAPATQAADDDSKLSKDNRPDSAECQDGAPATAELVALGRPPPPPPLPPASAEEHRFFYEDEVYGWDGRDRLRFGLVMETFDANFSDSDQSDDEEVLKPGEVRVAWHPRGTEQVMAESRIGLADRTLMPGDVVRRVVPGQQTQKGYCREVHVYADVNIKGTECMLRRVPAHRMRNLIATMRDNAVCLDSWVGSSRLVNLKLVLRTAGGSVLELRPDQEYTRLVDADCMHRSGCFSSTSFYPGQVLVGPLDALDGESVKWITSMPDVRNTKTRLHFTVVSVEVEGVVVQWKCKALSDLIDMTDEEFRAHAQPKSYVTGDDLLRLNRLNIFESCMLQINDKNYLRIEADDVAAVAKKHHWRRDCAQYLQQSEALGGCHRRRSQSSAPAPAAKTVLGAHKTQGNSNRRNAANGKPTAAAHLAGKKVPALAVTADNGGRQSAVEEEAVRAIAGGDADAESDGWVTEDEEMLVDMPMPDGGVVSSGGGVCGLLLARDAEAMGSMDSVLTGSSYCSSSPTPHSSPKTSPLLRNMRRQQMRRLHRQQQRQFDIADQIGQEVVTETRLVYSHAVVIWQDGTIEENISSCELYPIHHLDEHEFFPGDFVLSGNEVSYRDYGVIQRVDHAGRTAVVKWFSTYTSAGEPTPTFFNETEVSVYDLKDHPDFQYRPGTIVIRVGNFTGDDSKCTAGQVVDNYAEGRVKVWWVDGHRSMCWPQDLFEVGNYDADHGDWPSGEDADEGDDIDDYAEDAAAGDADAEDAAIAAAHSDADSWETDSVPSGGESAEDAAEVDEPMTAAARQLQRDRLGSVAATTTTGRPSFVRSMDRSLQALERLQSMFCQNPLLENVDALQQLLGVYKKCRFMDRMLETSFFHEDRFMGLIERVRRSASLAATPTATPTATLADPEQQTATGSLASAAEATTNTKPSIPPSLPTPTAFSRAIEHKRRLFGEAPAGPPMLAITSPPAQHPLKMPPISPSVSMHLKPSAKQKLHKMQRAERSKEATAPVGASCEMPSLGLCSSSPMATLSRPPDDGAQMSFSANDSGIQTKSSEGEASGGEASSSWGDATGGDSATTNSCCSSGEGLAESRATKHDLSVSTDGSELPKEGEEEEEEEEEASALATDDEMELATGEHDKRAEELNLRFSGAFHSRAKRIPLRPSRPLSGAPQTPGNCDEQSTDLPSEDADEVLSEYACARLCTLLKKQMRLALRYASNEQVAKKIAPIYVNLLKSNAPGRDAGDNKADSAHSSAESDDAAAADADAAAAADTKPSSPAEPEAAAATGGGAPPPPADCFVVLDAAPTSHHFHAATFVPANQAQFFRTVAYDHRLLLSSLPAGVWVRAYEGRMDLMSVMIAGPARTPYEDGVFLFDVQLSKEYPRTPPLFHYVSFCADRLNPNLYEDGKVCVSLLGTWSGRGSEVWGAGSTLLQVIVSIQGLILVAEPYYNEAGYERQKGSQQGHENSRMYNEMVVIKLVQSMIKVLQQPHAPFAAEIRRHFRAQGRPMYERLQRWLHVSNEHNAQPVGGSETTTAEFPLVPASRGFCLTLAGLLETFGSKVDAICPEPEEREEAEKAMEAEAAAAAPVLEEKA